MKGKSTKARLIECGTEIIHAQGYHHTGIQEILKAAQVPKGSFYFHFKSKEDFCLALIDQYGAQMVEQMDAHLKESACPPLQRLRNFFAHFRREFKAQGFTKGCLIGNLASEMSDVNPPVRLKLQETLGKIEARLAECLSEAHQAGDLPAHVDAAQMAAFVLNSWEGTLVRMKTTRSITPLRLFEKTIFSFLVYAPDPDGI